VDAKREHGGYVLAVNPLHYARLASKELSAHGRSAAAEYLHGHVDGRREVTSREDASHAAFTEALLDLEILDHEGCQSNGYARIVSAIS
jgi:hypothetical protein